MRIAIFLLLVGFLQTQATDTYSQNTKLSISFSNTELVKVLDKIENQSEFYFLYNEKLIDATRKVSIEAKEEEIEDVLKNLFSGTNIEYSIIDRKIILAPAYLSESQQNGKKISGKVTDSSGGIIPGVSIIVKGTTTGVVTDENGSYTLTNIPENATLQFSFVGMKTQEIIVGSRIAISVTLVEDAVGLEEVVAIGYGTQKRTTITGSVSVIKGDEISKSPVDNISNSIAGKMSGVSMKSNGGQPGNDNPTIYIRGISTTGANSPLIIVDGITRDNISQIDPSIIESISVLKDAASVAPFGLGGANGVILITTKKGALGAPTITFNVNYGWQTPTVFPHTLNAKEYMTLKNEAYLNENPGLTTIPFPHDILNNYAALHAENPDLYPDSKIKNVFNMVTPLQKYDFQLSGGSERIKYFTGIGYYNQDGMFGNKINYKRINANMSLEAQVTKTTTLSFALIGSVEHTKNIDPAFDTSSGLLWSIYKYIPLQPINYTNGLWGGYVGFSPVAVLKSDGYNMNEGNTMLSTFTIEQQLPFIKGLSLKATASYDSKDNFIKGWHVPAYFYAQNTSTTPFTYDKEIAAMSGSAPPTSYLIQTQTQSKIFTYQAFVNYHRLFGVNDFTGLLVAEARNTNYAQLMAERYNFNIMIDELNMGSSSKSDYDNRGSSSEGSQIGYVYRLGYVNNNKYMLEASGRYDGHYYFAPGKKWGYFPAFSVGWRLSEEKFMKSLAFINNLKIRASWGKSGNLAGSAYQYLSGYAINGTDYAFGTGNMVQGAYAAQEANPNITWEISTKSDIGLEASLWKNLLMVEADYFFERRTGMLLAPTVTVPIEYGLSLAQQNGGEMENHGIELTVGSNHEFQNGLHLGLNGNFNFAKNKMVQVYETAATYSNPNRRMTGRSLNTPFGYHALGLFSIADDRNGDGIIDGTDGYNITQFGVLHPGDVKYQDISGPDGIPDGKIDANDQVPIGYPTYPSMSYGFTASAEWKGFDLSLFFQGSSRVTYNIYDEQTVPFLNNNSNADLEYYNNHWTSDNQNATYPRATSSPYANNIQTSDFWMRNTSYLRLKTCTFGYSFPTSVTQPLKIKNIRVYLTAQNILTFSRLNFMDPEMGAVTTYPYMKSVSIGAKVTF